MKTKIVTVISLAGVLIAGSAAALVNTQVLGGSASPSPLVVDAAPPLQTTPVVTAAPIVTTPAVTTPVVAAPAVAAPAAPAPVATQAVYAIGESGTVTLDTTGGQLTIVGVTPANGWTVTKSEIGDALDAEIKFQSGAIEVEFHANLSFGVVTTSVDSHDLSTAVDSNSGNGGGYNGGGDDGGESDEGGGDDD